MAQFIVTRNRFPEAIAHLEQAAINAVQKVAADMKADAQQRAPIDTGHLRASAYYRRNSALVYRVGFTASYALYVELGTRRMRAQPYLIPAWVAGRYKLMQAFRRIGILG